jgi:hypothetical protein
LIENREVASAVDFDVSTLTVAVRNDIDIFADFLSVSETIT